MNKLVTRGFSAYKIFLKNKIASSIMMLFSGFMMFIAALNGQGNDTKSLPTLITSVGAILTLWGVYKIGVIKSHLDTIDPNDQVKRSAEKKVFILQILETLLYAVVAGVGIFLLLNESFINKILDLMAGGFTTLNGVLGAINAFKNKDNIDFRWKLMLVLTILELIIGPYFIFASNTINTPGYIIMGALTTMAGIVEVVSAMTRDNIKTTIDDGKEIIHIIKDDESEGSGPIIEPSKIRPRVDKTKTME